jgi:hypothetical protein
MKRFLIVIFCAGGLVAPALSSAWAQEVSGLNQDMDNRPNLQSDQPVGGLTSAPGVNVQKPSPAHRSKKRRPASVSKTPPRFHGPAPTRPQER